MTAPIQCNEFYPMKKSVTASVVKSIVTKFIVLRNSLLICVLIAAAFGARTAVAQDVVESSRAHVYDFLNVVANPRSSALGNSFVAMKNDVNVIFSNPGALSTLGVNDSIGVARVLSVGFTKYILDINEGYLSYAQPIADSASWIGAGVQYMDYGTFQGYDTKGLATGDFGASDFALSVAYSGTAKHAIHYGVALKYIISHLVSGSSVENYSSTALAADAGLFYEFEPALMTFGVSVLNVGSQLTTYAGVREALPLDVQIGVSKKLERLPLTLHLAFHNLTRDREGRSIFYALNDFSFGGEFVLGKVVRLRVGYENQKRHDLKLPTGSGLAGFSLGAGFVVKRYQFDYAFNSLGLAFQPLHRLGATITFD
jgi:hypothetical protein